ncbi:Hypothetical protein POVR1_LOCUS59 [uncultured virus]|nr:Hypothetical protein POVR1_LOCUS59 [uncultured virus]
MALANLPGSILDEDLTFQEFKMHNEFVIELGILRFKGQYADEIKTYDAYQASLHSYARIFGSTLLWVNSLNNSHARINANRLSITFEDFL